ncbi:hypothetical protein ACFVWY_10155 [Streptomyces sp. NPDC058195]|uniref:hypothetical protein n=1 Tax=Streptomyces sp. NPDC058195 TaxID=3346375 RepID=UPI0036E5DACE
MLGQWTVTVFVGLAVFELCVLAGCVVGLFADPVHVICDHVVDIDGHSCSVAEPAATHQAGDEEQAVATGGLYVVQLLNGRYDGPLWAVLWGDEAAEARTAVSVSRSHRLAPVEGDPEQ